jgi:hypothetical protein
MNTCSNLEFNTYFMGSDITVYSPNSLQNLTIQDAMEDSSVLQLQIGGAGGNAPLQLPKIPCANTILFEACTMSSVDDVYFDVTLHPYVCYLDEDSPEDAPFQS